MYQLKGVPEVTKRNTTTTIVGLMLGLFAATVAPISLGAGDEAQLSATASANLNATQVHHWAVGGRDLLCSITTATESGPTENRLAVSDNGKEVFSIGSDAEPIAMLSDAAVDGRLITVWMSGSGAFQVRVFSYKDGEITQVLFAGSKWLPEFVYSLESQKSPTWRIVLTNGTWYVDEKTGAAWLQPTTADVYSWKGTSYKTSKGVPWRNRLR